MKTNDTLLTPDPYQQTRTMTFDSYNIIAGITPMIAGYPYDEVIDRPLGMKGYIVHLTIQGEGLITDGHKRYICQTGDMLLYPAHVPHLYKTKS